MKALFSLIISGALVVSGYAQTRNVLVGTNNAVVQPTNFWSADAVNARSGLGLGSAATNPSSAFQPASSILTNISQSNGAGITNIAASNIVGILSISRGGTSATNVSEARTYLGLGSAATNPATAFQPASTVLSNLASSNAINLTNLQASNMIGAIAISNGGSGATTAGGARTNLGLGASNEVVFDAITANTITIGTPTIQFANQGIVTFDGDDSIQIFTNRISFFEPIDFDNTSLAATTRTNLGLGWPALTNTTASGFQTALFGTNTNPVFVNTNGEVVSPTNFWQVAPITTTFIESQPTTNSSTNISPSRLLHIHSLATNVVNTTNTIILPTNALTFEGDMALVVHKGPTNSLTQVRQAGSTNNLITLNKFNEAVEFTYYNNTWQFLETAAFTAPIYFSGTNASANAAASRTNLGLGATNDVTFESVNAQELSAPLVQSSSGTNSVAITPDDIEFAGIAAAATRTNLGLGATWLTNADVTNFRTAIGLGVSNGVIFNDLILEELSIGADGISFQNEDGKANTRANLGLGASNIVTFAGITNNGDIRINQTATNNGLLYIYRTNAEPFLGLANLIASNNVTVSNESLFRVGVAEATNKAAQFGFRSTNTNGNGVAVFSVFGYNALMMIGPSDPNAGTNPIQATVYSVSPNNKVMTLITTNTGATLFHRAIEFENTTNQAVTRTNLGLPLAALTNTNNAGFQRAIFQTNTTPTNGANLGDAKAWIEISVVTNSVTNSYRIPVFQ